MFPLDNTPKLIGISQTCSVMANCQNFIRTCRWGFHLSIDAPCRVLTSIQTLCLESFARASNRVQLEVQPFLKFKLLNTS